MGALMWFLIAVIYFLAAIAFAWRRDWPSVLISAGCVLVLVGNLWQLARGQ
jgi:uncharacterized membrane protein